MINHAQRLMQLFHYAVEGDADIDPDEILRDIINDIIGSFEFALDNQEISFSDKKAIMFFVRDYCSSFYC